MSAIRRAAAVAMPTVRVSVTPRASNTPGARSNKEAVRTKLLRKIRALKKATSKSTPAEVVGTALRLWCERVYPELPPARLPFNLRLSTKPQVIGLVDSISALGFLDAAYWLSTTYAALNPEARRRDLAMYFTPPPIARRLIKDVERQGADFSKHSFIDPACGGASFIALTAMEMRRVLVRAKFSPRAILKHAQKHLVGQDVDPTLCTLTKQFLRIVFYEEYQKVGRLPTFTVECANALKKRWNRRFDVVLCNPPFRKMNGDEADAYRRKFARVMHGQPNLYALFMDLTVRLAKPGGIVGLVTPTSFISGQYFSSVRTFLLEHSRVRHIGLVHERQRVYMDVEQETALTMLQARPDIGHGGQSVRVSAVQRDGRYDRLGRCHLPNSGTSWPIPRRPEDVVLIRSLGTSPYRIADYGYEPRIGAFVWNRDERKTYATLKEVPVRRRKRTVPLLWATDVARDGRLKYQPHSAEHAQARFIDLGDNNSLGLHDRASVLLQRVSSSDQQQRLVGAVVSEKIVGKFGGFVGENHTVILTPDSDEPKLTPEQMRQLLTSAPIEQYFRCISGSANVSVFELSQLPLPNPEELVKKICSGLSVEQATQRLLLGRHKAKAVGS